MDAEFLLREVGATLQLPLKLDPKTRRCVIQDKSSKQEYLLEMPLKNPFIYIYSILKQLTPEHSDESFLQALLELNLFGLQTDSCTISVDRSSRNILLHLTFPMEFLTPQLLVNLLTNFIATTRKLQAKIENLEIVTNKELRKQKTYYSAADSMDEKNPKHSMRVIRI
jgi:hypothetical protein